MNKETLTADPPSVSYLQDLLRLARQYVLGHYAESQYDAESREALIQAIDEAAPPPPPREPYVGCDIGKYCAQRKGHTGDCDDLPF